MEKPLGLNSGNDRSTVPLSYRKYKDVPFEELPDSYWEWLEKAKWLELVTMQRHMKSRGMAVHEPAVREVVKTLPLTRLQNEMIEAGYRRIAVKYHPDKGGDTVKMQALNAEMARARAALKVTTKSFTVEDEDL